MGTVRAARNAQSMHHQLLLRRLVPQRVIPGWRQEGTREEPASNPPVTANASAKRKTEAAPRAATKKAKTVSVSFSARGVCESSSGGKFWSVSVSGSEMTTSWGKLGSTGQTKVKDCGSEDKAVKEAEKLQKAKLKGGYVMEDGDSDVEESDASPVGPAVYLKEERAFDGTYNNEVPHSSITQCHCTGHRRITQCHKARTFSI